jgi:hypothetical protein
MLSICLGEMQSDLEDSTTSPSDPEMTFVLSKDNITDFLEQHSAVLVMFYAPWYVPITRVPAKSIRTIILDAFQVWPL